MGSLSPDATAETWALGFRGSHALVCEYMLAAASAIFGEVSSADFPVKKHEIQIICAPTASSPQKPCRTAGELGPKCSTPVLNITFCQRDYLFPRRELVVYKEISTPLLNSQGKSSSHD